MQYSSETRVIMVIKYSKPKHAPQTSGQITPNTTTQQYQQLYGFEVPQISLFALVELRVAYIEARRVGNVILGVPPTRSVPSFVTDCRCLTLGEPKTRWWLNQPI